MYHFVGCFLGSFLLEVIKRSQRSFNVFTLNACVDTLSLHSSQSLKFCEVDFNYLSVFSSGLGIRTDPTKLEYVNSGQFVQSSCCIPIKRILQLYSGLSILQL